MSLAAGPNFVEQEGARRFHRAVQIISQTVIFLARGPYQSSQFGLQECLLPFARAKMDDESHGILRELGASGSPGPT